MNNMSSSSEKIGLALGGGFARGIAHAGVLQVFERYRIPIHCIAGVSAGSIVATAYSSGATTDAIARAGASMRFRDVAQWTLSAMGFARSSRMESFLRRLLKQFRFEDMRIPLGVVATDLGTGNPVIFRDHGDVNLAVRASCSYPGLFTPVNDGARLLVDGGISMEIPAEVCRSMGATRVISVNLPSPAWKQTGANVFNVVNRCIQIVQARTNQAWRETSDVVIAPDVQTVSWNGFGSADAMIRAGEQATLAVLPEILSWIRPTPSHVDHERDLGDLVKAA